MKTDWALIIPLSSWIKATSGYTPDLPKPVICVFCHNPKIPELTHQKAMKVLMTTLWEYSISHVHTIEIKIVLLSEWFMHVHLCTALYLPYPLAGMAKTLGQKRSLIESGTNRLCAALILAFAYCCCLHLHCLSLSAPKSTSPVGFKFTSSFYKFGEVASLDNTFSLQFPWSPPLNYQNINSLCISLQNHISTCGLGVITLPL